MNKSGMEKFGAFVLGLISFIVLVIFNAFVLTALWGWFIVPLLGFPVLTITYAIGLNLVISMFKNNNIKKEKEYEVFEAFVIGFIRPSLALLLGWIVTLFM